MTFFEKELHRLFDDSECISADAVFAGKTMIGESIPVNLGMTSTATFNALGMRPWKLPTMMKGG